MWKYGSIHELTSSAYILYHALCHPFLSVDFTFSLSVPLIHFLCGYIFIIDVVVIASIYFGISQVLLLYIKSHWFGTFQCSHAIKCIRIWLIHKPQYLFDWWNFIVQSNESLGIYLFSNKLAKCFRLQISFCRTATII